jgi:cytochrome c-type biogenesis protein CcsB
MQLFFFSDYQLPIVGCIFLFFAMIGYWVSLSIPKNEFLFFINKKLVFGSNILFALTLLVRWIGEGYFPLSNLYESLIFLSWGISSVHLFVEEKTKSRLIGAIASPIVFFLSSFSSLTLPTEMQKALPLVPSLQSNWLMMHVSMMMISYSTLIVGSLLSLFYLAFSFFIQKKKFSTQSVQNTLRLTNQSIIETSSILTSSKPSPDLVSQLVSSDQTRTKSKTESITGKQLLFPFLSNSFSSFTLDSTLELGEFEKLENLEKGKQEEKTKQTKYSLLQTIDIWSYRIIGLGFPFLTIGIISGAVWANEAWGSYWSWDPKETWALITWLVFAIYLHSRLLKGWQGEKTAWIGSVGFFVIWICYLGVNFLGKGLHSYGWVLN